MGKVALITGISGQDGSYLAEFLRARGYAVHGTLNYASSVEEAAQAPKSAGGETPGSLQLHAVNLLDANNLTSLLLKIEPDEFYHLGAQSDVRLSFQIPLQTADTIILGTMRALESLRAYERISGKKLRMFHAASSELFGLPESSPQTEETPFHPRNPYACAKVFAYWQTLNYREAYNIFACNGILYNHESPRRGELYVTRKITRAAGRIKAGLQSKLRLGHLDSRRDWGFAGDYVDAMWRMLQADVAEDFVIATGETHSVRDFLDEVFGYLNLDWHDYVEVDKAFFRPADVGLLCGNASKARKQLDWQPSVDFSTMARMLAEHDWKLAQEELAHHLEISAVLDPAT